nr:6139_t:CDS:1 [Entrophospora candida]
MINETFENIKSSSSKIEIEEPLISNQKTENNDALSNTVKHEVNGKAETDGALSNMFKPEASSNANEGVGTITILLFGRIGSGKTTLADVIEDANNTKERSCKYEIIDTVGIGDRKLTTQEILYQFVRNIDDIKGGFNQILFVTNGRFKEEEIDAYDLLQSVIFDQDIVNFTTIVRTNFPDFENGDVCDKDRSNMINENNKLSAIIKKCKMVIHVDNPPITHRTKQVAEEIREESRKKILNHLDTCKSIYKPPSLDELNNRIKAYIDYMIDIEKLGRKDKGILRKILGMFISSFTKSYEVSKNLISGT